MVHCDTMQHMTTGGEYLGVPALAAVLGKNRSTIYRRVARGTLEPSLYSGRSALFSSERVEELRRLESEGRAPEQSAGATFLAEPEG